MHSIGCYQVEFYVSKKPKKTKKERLRILTPLRLKSHCEGEAFSSQVRETNQRSPLLLQGNYSSNCLKKLKQLQQLNLERRTTVDNTRGNPTRTTISGVVSLCCKVPKYRP